MIFKEEQKSLPITKGQVWKAYEKVAAKGGSHGVDGVTIKEVRKNPRKYLYPLWNRMASGSYFPKAVRQVGIPKADGTKRNLGIPTVVDRVGQQVIKDELEEIVDKQFSENSYGYRTHKSAHQALEQCRKNCMEKNWVIDLDIKGFFDNIDHELMLKAVRHVTGKKHILLYVERWLKAPVELSDGKLEEREGKGTPQGGVISPLLANIFLHFVFDKWMEKTHPRNNFERYADDIIVHCNDEKEAREVLKAIEKRLKECKLESNQQKTKIVYCRRRQKGQPKEKPKNQKFDFLGFTFKPRVVKMGGKCQMGFTPAISAKSEKRIGEEVHALKIHRMVQVPLTKIAEILRAKTKGWVYYYGKFRKSEMRRVFYRVNVRIAQMVRSKFRRFRNRCWYESYKWLKALSKEYPRLFLHWEYGFCP